VTIVLALCVASAAVNVRLSRVLKLLRRTGWCVRMGRTLFQGRKVRTAVKHKVSQNKSWYVDVVGNFDLDLTYISSTVIVPTDCWKEVLYRNRLADVVRFFKTRHPGSFRIYNACPECSYQPTGFRNVDGTVKLFDIRDHTPPTMNQFVEFLTDAHEFLTKAHESAVIAVHCKGGKGRTGSLVCAWLLFSRNFSPDQALSYFANKRTDQFANKLCGVETPLQVRYVHQVHKYLQSTRCWDIGGPPPHLGTPTRITLTALHFEGGLIAQPAKMGRLKVLVQCGGVNISRLVKETGYFEADVMSIPLNGVVVGGDVRVSVFTEKGLKGISALNAIKDSSNAYDARGITLFFLFHTDFLDVTLTDGSSDPSAVERLDKAHKNVKKGKHAAGSSAVLHYGIMAPF